MYTGGNRDECLKRTLNILIFLTLVHKDPKKRDRRMCYIHEIRRATGIYEKKLENL